MGLQQTSWCLGRRLDPLTGSARGDVAAHELRHAGPPVVLSNGVERTEITRMSSRGGVVEFSQNACP